MTRILLLFCFGLLSLAAAQDAVKLEDLVEQLGNDDFKIRQKASDELMRRVEKDPEFAKQLKPFAQHEDPEVRFRIAELTKDLPLVLEWVDPAMEKEMKSSRRSFSSMKLTVKNRSNIEIQTHWLDWTGTRQPRRVVKPGQEMVIAKTYAGHPWLLTDPKGMALGIYVPKGEKEVQIIYTGKEGKK